IWPRLIWNYEEEKLVQITWDAQENSEAIWEYNQYYSDDTTANTLNAVEAQLIAPQDFETDQPKFDKKSVLFYSGVLKAEHTLASGITTFAMIVIASFF